MSKLKCFENGPFKDKYLSAINDNMSEDEKLAIGIKMATDYYKNLVGELNKIRTESGLPAQNPDSEVFNYLNKFLNKPEEKPSIAEDVEEKAKIDLERKIEILNDKITTTYRFIDNTDNNSTILKAEEDIKKYQEERRKLKEQLASLEGKKEEVKPAKIEAPAIKKLGKLGKPASEFRLVREGEKGFITDEEIEIFKKWAAENVPGIPYEVLERIYVANDGRRAWGVFEQGVAKFYKGAIKGTEYHEVFEGIWKHFLSAEEKHLLLDEFRSNKGSFVDRASGKKIDYNQATDKQAKERIADDFADYRVHKISKKSLGQRILDFFKRIAEFFKLTNTNKKDKLFDEIEKGRFREAKSPFVITSEVEFSQIPGLTESQVNEIVQDITARAFKKIFGENRSLYDIQKLTAPEIFDSIRDEYIEFGFVDNNDPSKLSDKEFNDILIRVRDFLRTFKITFDDNNLLTINDENVDSKLYAPEPFSTDWKKSSSFAIKLLLASLTEAKPLNQENSKSIELPDENTGDLGGFKLFNFSRAFATLINKLSNTSTIYDFEQKFLQLVKSDSNYVRLFTRLGGNRKNGALDFSNFKDHDWRLFIEFFQTFTKQKPDALIQYVIDGNTYTGTANLFSAANLQVEDWIQNIRVLAKDKKSAIKYDSETKTYKAIGLKDIKIGTPEEAVEFLSKIGVQFPIEVYKKLSDEQKTDFSKSVSAIRTHVLSEEGIVNVTGEALNVEGHIRNLAELLISITNPNIDLSYFGINNNRRQLHSENNYSSVFENMFNVSDSLDDLLENRPELKDTFSKNSVVLKPGGLFFKDDGTRKKTIKISYIQGTENTDKGKSTSTDRLSISDRMVQEINQNVNGNYYILVPADSSTEWMINLGNNIKYEDVQDGSSWNKVYSIFKGYLEDEFNLALEDRKYLRATSPRAKELRFFSGILSEKLLEKAHDAIKNKISFSEFYEANSSEINESIKSFIEEANSQTVNFLKKNNKITVAAKAKADSPTKFIFNSLDSDFKTENGLKNELSEKQLNDVIEFINVNYIINNIELHKLIFGDPYQFEIKKGQLDETKRIKSFLSPRRTTFDTTEYNNFLNEEYNKAGEINLSPQDPGYHVHKSYTKTVTLADVNVLGSIASSNLPKEIKDAYAKTVETDAASWIMDNTYREVKLKNAQWSPEAEAWYQWQMAYTRQNMPGYKYTNSALEKHDKDLLSKPEPNYKLDVLKPIVSGVKRNKESIELVLDKFSQMPIFYSMVEDTNLEKLYIKMWNEKIGYAVFESGRKVGIQKTHSLYNEDGFFNTEAFSEDSIVDIPWKIYGIQVENSYDGPKQQTRGSQITKLSSLDMFDNGVAISEEAQKEYQRNKDILQKMHENGYKNLLKKLGIRDNDGSFILEDKASVSQLLQRELLRREASENFKDVLKINSEGEFNIPFEASASYIQIRDILYSLVDKAILSPKMSGGAHVQVPVTLWESSKEGRKVVTVNGKKVFTDSTLKFYTKEDPYCEVYLPAWFKDKLKKGKYKTDEELLKYLNSTEEGQSILKGIGFRIPTQAMSSIEVFRVKGFLPSYMGSTVVVPSEITTKAGSDFDIDKLNMYLKAVYIDSKGNPRLVRYYGSEQETRAFYNNLYLENISKEIESLTKYKDFRDKLVSVFETIESIEDRSNLTDEGLEFLLGEENADFYFNHKNLLQTIADQAYEANLLPSQYIRDQIERLGETETELYSKMMNQELREKYVDDMYKASLENEYYDSLEKLLTLPENFERLVSPVNDGGLKDVSVKLDKLRNNDETTIKNRLLNRNYMSFIRHAFVTGKKWVGIAAVNITGHSLTQKSEVFVDVDKFDELPLKDKAILGNGRVVLPHNKTKDGKISMSGVKTADGKEYISDRLSGYATSFVDVAKDPYILKIIKSELVIGTFMFLERIGAGKYTSMFLNQPIIEKYLDHLENKGVRNVFNLSEVDAIKQSFVTSEQELENAEIDISSLEDNIEKFYKNGEKFESLKDNAVQHLILDEFLKYAKMAEYSFKLTQASNYDTTNFRSQDMLFKKQSLTSQARDKNIFSSVDKLLDSSFIGGQSILLDYMAEALGEVMKLDSYDLRSITNEVLKFFALKPYFSAANYETVGTKLTASFLDYIIQVKSGMNSRIKELLVDKNNVAERVLLAKKEHPNVAILEYLEPAGSVLEGGAVSIRIKSNVKQDAYNENLLTEMFREMRDNPDTAKLYQDIVELSFLQGTYQSAISIGNVIPLEDRAKYVSDLIKTIVPDEALRAFSKGAFYRNNWKDKNIVPRYTPKFFASDIPVGTDAYENDIYQYTSPAFPNIKTLGIQASDRKLMMLTEKYDSFYTDNDFLVVPRIITYPDGSMVDIKNGKTVTRSMLKARKKKGDLSHKQLYGYQKVKYANGEPLIFVEKGEIKYVYKLINLWGDGQFASEYYTENKPSVINNNTAKIETEIPDADIIRFYSPKIQEPTPAVLSEPEVTEQKPSEKTVQAPAVVNINLQPDNREKIVNGEKTTTIRTQKEFEYIGLPIGATAKTNVNGVEFEVTNRGLFSIDEVGKEAILKSEGLSSPEEFKFPTTKAWFEGKGKLYIYDFKRVKKAKDSTKKSIFEIRENPLDYTQGQRKALSDIENMIDSGKQGYYLLAGYAGTGKTTIAENIVKYAKQSGKEPYVLAPTNKAVNVLKDKLKATNAPSTAMTIHSAIYGEPDPATGEWVQQMTMKNSLILIDESSMIAKEVMTDLLNATRMNNILVFIGDSFQLEQVGEDSGLFGVLKDASKFESTYGVKFNGFTELTEVKRQSLESNVLKVATVARIDNKAYVLSESTEDFKLAKSRDEFIKEFKASIRNNEDSIMIVATNNERVLMNNIARIEKFGANKAIVNEGDTMVAISNSSSFSNSELFTVKTLRGEPVKYTIRLTDNKGVTKSYDMYFTYFKDDKGQEQKMMLFPDYDKASLYHAQVLAAIKNSNPSFYQELDNGYDIIRTKKSIKLSPAITIGTYGYAVTAHKSQGSQWNKVFVNQNFVAPGWNGARWFYTAITRAVNKVTVLPTVNNTKISMDQVNNKLAIQEQQGGTDQLPDCI